MNKLLEKFKKLFSKENLVWFFKSFIWLFILLFVIDIATKWAVVKHFGIDEIYTYGGVRDYDSMIKIIPGFLYIGGSINPNAAFSLAISKDPIANRVIYICISAIMTIIFVWYYIKNYKKLNQWTKAALVLMTAGAFGNLIDRAFYWEKTVGFNGVVDWIEAVFFYGTEHEFMFAMFNVADSCLVVGVGILLVLIIIDMIKDSIKKAKAGEYKYSPEELENQKKNEESNNK